MITQTMVALLLAEPSVTALVGNRIYPVQAPDAPDFPLLVVTKPTGTGEYDMGGDAGIEDARVQIDVYSDNGEAHVLTVKQAVRRFLSGFKGGASIGRPCAIDACMCINDFDLSEASTERSGPRLKRRVLEFRVWNTEI